MEIWKDIKNYEAKYQVSNEGRVRSINYNNTNEIKILKNQRSHNGYLFIHLCKNNKPKNHRIHRLVAEAFISNPDNLPQVNHKDEDKTNNRVENLEWCTIAYNNNYGSHNFKVSLNQINDKNKSKQVYQYTIDGKLVKIWPSTKECDRNGFNRCSVGLCCRGKQKYYKGYRWSYEPL